MNSGAWKLAMLGMTAMHGCTCAVEVLKVQKQKKVMQGGCQL